MDIPAPIEESDEVFDTSEGQHDTAEKIEQFLSDVEDAVICGQPRDRFLSDVRNLDEQGALV